MHCHRLFTLFRLFFLWMILILALCALSCGPGLSGFREVRVEEKVVVTKKIINQYRLNDEILSNLRFYISEPLTLEATETINSAEADPVRHRLNAKTTIDPGIISIEQYLEGRCIKLIPEHKPNPRWPSIRRGPFKMNWEPMRMHINFDQDFLHYLVFVADETSGDFILEYDEKSNTVEYGGRRYKCRDGCGKHLLLFDIQHDEEELEPYVYQMPGSPFPEVPSDRRLEYFLYGLVAGALIKFISDSIQR